MTRHHPLMRAARLSLLAAVLVTAGLALSGAEPQAQRSDQWIDLTQPKMWQNPEGWTFTDHTVALPKKGNGWLWSKHKYENFILELEFKTTGNSGVFFRADPDNPVHRGFEVQVHKRPDKKNLGKHDVGALYDVRAPSANAAKKDGWNHLRLRCKGPQIACWLNNVKLWQVDISQWTKPKRNPDGSKNKFKNALAKLPRNNHIGFQDHGNPVQYRNVRIRRLDE